MDWLKFITEFFKAAILFMARQAGKDAALRDVAEKKVDDQVEALGIEDRYRRDVKFRNGVQDRFNG